MKNHSEDVRRKRMAHKLSEAFTVSVIEVEEMLRVYSDRQVAEGLRLSAQLLISPYDAIRKYLA